MGRGQGTLKIDPEGILYGNWKSRNTYNNPLLKMFDASILGLENGYYDNLDGWSGNDQWLVKYPALPSIWLAQSSYRFEDLATSDFDWATARNTDDWVSDWAAGVFHQPKRWEKIDASEEATIVEIEFDHHPLSNIHCNEDYVQAIEFLLDQERQWMYHSTSHALTYHSYDSQTGRLSTEPLAFVYSER